MIALKKVEVEYMLSVLDLTPELRAVLKSIFDGGNVDEDQADALRDRCNDKLDVCGYDESYSLNEDGKRLEALADKLYVG